MTVGDAFTGIQNAKRT